MPHRSGASHQCAVFAKLWPLNSNASTWLPNVIHESVRLPGWPVTAPPVTPVFKYNVIASICPCFTGKFIGSDTASAAFGMVTELLPPLNVTLYEVLARIPTPPAVVFVGSAIATLSIVTSFKLNAFVKRSRI